MGSHTGVKAITGLRQHIEPPQLCRSEPPIGNPVTQHRLSRGMLQGFPGAVDVLPKQSGRHFFDAAMVVSFTCHFMTTFCDLSHEFGSCLRHTTKHEECRSRVEVVEQGKGFAGTDLESPL